MESAIGRIQAGNSATLRRILALAMLAITIDVACILLKQRYDVRLAIAFVAFAGFVILLDGDLQTLGLRLNPIQGWKTWIGWAFKIGVAVTLLILIGQIVWTQLGNELSIYVTHPQQASQRVISACLLAPILEETVYRLFVCVPLVPLVGCRSTIVASGILFGFLHVLYGNPSPENLFGGFFLAWAYLKSESIVVPLLLHSFGNGVVVASQVAGWYFMQQPA